MIEVTSPGYPRALRSLAFPVGFVFAVVVHRSLKGVEAVGPRHIFLAFILLYALQGMSCVSVMVSTAWSSSSRLRPR